MLNLRLNDDGWEWPIIADRKALVLKRFKTFEPLRLLGLKRAKVILFFNPTHPPIIDDQNVVMETARLEETLSQRLLDPTITKADLVNAMTERIKRLEFSKGQAQVSVEVNRDRAEEARESIDRCLAAAERYQIMANAKRDAIERLQIGLQRDNREEMKRLLMQDDIDEEAWSNRRLSSR